MLPIIFSVHPHGPKIRALITCIPRSRGVSRAIGRQLQRSIANSRIFFIPRNAGKMVLEATMVCMDNSEWMRNGDYSPTRFQAQADAVNLICGAKTQSNPENTVGVLTMAGKGPRVLITPTNDLGKILQALHDLEVGGEISMASGVQVAQLALKHRQNKHQRQRIVLFAGSPVLAEKKVLEGMGKKLKKNNVALDIVSFGEDDGEKVEKLEALLNAVNSNENSHIVHIPGGDRVLSDVLISSSVFTGDGEGGSGFAAAAAASAAAAAVGGGGGGAYDFGVDPNLDPELVLALRVSMEEERARQEAAMKRSAEDSTAKQAGESSGAADVSMSDAGPVEITDKSSDMMIDDDTALLEQALAMSMAEAAANAGPAAVDMPMAESGGDDQDLAYALQISMQETAASASAAQGSVGVNQALGDQISVYSMLSSLPGVDLNDPSVRDALEAIRAHEEKSEDKASKGKGKEG